MILATVELIEEETENNYDYIKQEFNLPVNSNEHKKAEYLLETIHKRAGWDVVLNIVFGNEPMVQNEGLLGLEEEVIGAKKRYIQNRKEHGFSREKSFKHVVENEPEWIAKSVARTELDYYEGSMYMIEPSVEEMEYIKTLQEYLDEE